MGVLYDPRASMTDAQRRDAEATIARRRRLDGNEARERAERAAQCAAKQEVMIEALKAEIDPAPLVSGETWEDRQARLNPLPTEKPEWFVIEAEIDQDAKRIRIEDIQRAVATRYNITRAELICARRTAKLVRPRQIAMFLSKSLTPKSYPEIGRRFGGRDHTTALHAFRKIEALVERDPDVADEIDRLSNLIQGMN